MPQHQHTHSLPKHSIRTKSLYFQALYALEPHFPSFPFFVLHFSKVVKLYCASAEHPPPRTVQLSTSWGFQIWKSLWKRLTCSSCTADNLLLFFFFLKLALAAPLGENVHNNKMLMDHFSMLGINMMSFINRHFPTFFLTDMLWGPDKQKSPSVAWVLEQCVLLMMSWSSGSVEDLKK